MRKWFAIWAIVACGAACTGSSGSGTGAEPPPDTQEPPSPEPPPPDPENGGVTIEGSGQTFQTIQAAIDAASHGDVLELAAGTYREAVVLTRAVTLRGSEGASRTVLDGDDKQRIVTIAPELGDRTVRIEGVRFRFGRADPGGAIRVSSGQLECDDCIFDRCTSFDRAGAVTVESTSGPMGTTAVFRNCEFRECSSGARGGAVYLTAGTDDSNVNATFEECRFERNMGNQGGAVFVSAGTGAARVEARFDRCLFQENGGKDGGAILAETGAGETTVRVDLLQCVLSRNAASGEGGAVLARAVAGSSGAVVRLLHCTVTENLAPDLPGSRAALAVTRGAATGVVRLELDNSIVWENSPRSLDTIDVDRVIRSSIVMGGVPEPSNLDADPQFLFPDGNNFTLRDGSPAIDAGDPLLLDPGLEVDLIGAPRIRGDAPDLGAYERE